MFPFRQKVRPALCARLLGRITVQMCPGQLTSGKAGRQQRPRGSDNSLYPGVGGRGGPKEGWRGERDLPCLPSSVPTPLYLSWGIWFAPTASMIT